MGRARDHLHCVASQLVQSLQVLRLCSRRSPLTRAFSIRYLSLASEFESVMKRLAENLRQQFKIFPNVGERVRRMGSITLRGRDGSRYLQANFVKLYGEE